MLNDDNDDEIKFTSEVVTVTDDMVDKNGNTIESKVPDPTAPDGYELGDVAPTDSPVVTVYELTEA